MTLNTAPGPPGKVDGTIFPPSPNSVSTTSQGNHKKNQRRFSLRVRKKWVRRDSESTCNSIRSGGSSSYSRSSSEFTLGVRSTSTSSSQRRRSKSKTKLVLIKMTPTKRNKKERNNVESNVRSPDGTSNHPKQHPSKRRSKKELAKIWTSGPQVADPMAGALFHHNGLTSEEQLDNLVKPLKKTKPSPKECGRENYNLQSGDDQCNKNTEKETTTESGMSPQTTGSGEPAVRSPCQSSTNGHAMDIAGISVPTPKSRSTIAKRLLSPGRKRNSPSSRTSAGLSVVSSFSSRTATSSSRKSWFGGRKNKMDLAQADRSECIDAKSLGEVPNSSDGGRTKKYRLRKWSKRLSAGFVLGVGTNSKRNKQEEELVQDERELEKEWLEGHKRNDDCNSSKTPQVGENAITARTQKNGLNVETNTTTSTEIASPTKEVLSPTRALNVEGSIDEASDSETSCSPAADNSNDHPLMQIGASSFYGAGGNFIPSEVGVADKGKREGIASQLNLCEGRHASLPLIRPESSGSEDKLTKKKKKRDIFKGIKKKRDSKLSSLDSITTNSIGDLTQGSTKLAKRSSVKKRRRSKRKKSLRVLVCAMLLLFLGLVYLKFNGFGFFFADRNDSMQHWPYCEQQEGSLLEIIPEERESDMIEEHVEEDKVTCEDDSDLIQAGNSILKRIFRCRINEIPDYLLNFVE